MVLYEDLMNSAGKSSLLSKDGPYGGSCRSFLGVFDAAQINRHTILKAHLTACFDFDVIPLLVCTDLTLRVSLSSIQY